MLNIYIDSWLNIVYPTKNTLSNEWEIKTFPEKQKLRWFVTSRPTLQEMLKGVIQGEMKGHGIITEEIKNTSKGGNTGKYRGQYKCIFVFNSFCSICESRSFVSDSLHSHGLQPATMLCPWDSPGKNAGVGFHALLQGIFPIQESNLGLLHCRQIIYCLSYHFICAKRWVCKAVINLSWWMHNV